MTSRSKSNPQEWIPIRGSLTKLSFGTWGYTVLWLPEILGDRVRARGTARPCIEARVGEVTFEAAWQPRDGSWFVLFSKDLQRQHGLEPGDEMDLEFRFVNQDRVIIPQELSEVLAADAGLKSAWDKLTSGRQRGLAHRVASAKSEAVRQRRVDEVILVLDGHHDGRRRR